MTMTQNLKELAKALEPFARLYEYFAIDAPLRPRTGEIGAWIDHRVGERSLTVEHLKAASEAYSALSALRSRDSVIEECARIADSYSRGDDDFAELAARIRSLSHHAETDSLRSGSGKGEKERCDPLNGYAEYTPVKIGSQTAPKARVITPAEEIGGYLATVADLSNRLEAAEAALSASKTGEGWKLVPVEPTEEMIESAVKGSRANISYFDAGECYRAMLAAAPSSPSEDGR